MRTVKTRSCAHAALLICAMGCGRACLAASCAVTAESLNFGAFTALGGPVEAIGRIIVTCRGVPGELVEYTVALSRSSATLGQRLLIDGEQTLEFDLFIDAARVTPWGDGTEGTSVVHAALELTGTIASREHIVYARVVPDRSTIPGNYADTIPVTLDYGT